MQEYFVAFMSLKKVWRHGWNHYPCPEKRGYYGRDRSILLAVISFSTVGFSMRARFAGSTSMRRNYLILRDSHCAETFGTTVEYAAGLVRMLIRKKYRRMGDPK
jgi:hypothetical protein